MLIIHTLFGENVLAILAASTRQRQDLVPDSHLQVVIFMLKDPGLPAAEGQDLLLALNGLRPDLDLQPPLEQHNAPQLSANKAHGSPATCHSQTATVSTFHCSMWITGVFLTHQMLEQTPSSQGQQQR